MYRITSLYPQYQYAQDRRQQNIPVEFDRRTGVDRRAQDRVKLDEKLTRDIFEVRGKVKDITGTISFDSSQNNVKNLANINAISAVQSDQFIKTQNQTEQNILANNTPDSPSRPLEAGLLAVALAGVLFTPFIGPIGAVIALGSTFYVGAKLLKSAVAQQVKDSAKKEEKA